MKTGVFKRILMRDLIDLHLVLSNIKQIFFGFETLKRLRAPHQLFIKEK